MVHFMQLWPFATRSKMETGSKRSQLHKMYQSRRTAKNSWWWSERLPETGTVLIAIKLEFSASVGFIHKESVRMHVHTIIKLIIVCYLYTQIHLVRERLCLPTFRCRTVSSGVILWQSVSMLLHGLTELQTHQLLFSVHTKLSLLISHESFALSTICSYLICRNILKCFQKG